MKFYTLKYFSSLKDFCYYKNIVKDKNNNIILDIQANISFD